MLFVFFFFVFCRSLIPSTVFYHPTNVNHVNHHEEKGKVLYDKCIDILISQKVTGIDLFIHERPIYTVSATSNQT